MAICRHFHKPDLFLTMTANPKWPEIIYSLFPGQTATDCPDIVLRVFEQKEKALLKLCHDLANWLSHYLYFFSFLFLFITTRWSVGKYHVTLSQCHNSVMDGHGWSSHSHSHKVSHD